MTKLSPRTYNAIAIGVLAVWAVLNIADAISAMYEVPAEIHGIAGIVVGAAFGGSFVSRNGHR